MNRDPLAESELQRSARDAVREADGPVTSIRSAIRGLDGWKLRAFVASCAEHVAPAFKLLASATSVPIFERALHSAWAVVTNDEENVASSLQLISRLPEAAVDDSHRREYYATLAMEVLENALRTSCDQDAHDSADLACCLAFDLYASFDGIASGSPNMVIDPKSPPPKGALESAEMNSLSNTLSILREESGRRDDIGRKCESEAKKSAQVLLQSLPALIRQRYGK